MTKKGEQVLIFFVIAAFIFVGCTVASVLGNWIDSTSDVTEVDGIKVDKKPEVQRGVIIKKTSYSAKNDYFIVVQSEDGTTEEVWKIAPRIYRSVELTDVVDKEDIIVED